jgi:hypothetical protein
MPASQATILRRELARRLAEELPRRYPHWGQIGRLDAIPGGFSGAALFRVNADAGTFAVKLSPKAEGLLEATVARHRVIEAIASNGERSLFPRLARDAGGASLWLLTCGAGTFVAEARDWLEDSRPQTAIALVTPDEIPGSAGSSVEVASAFELLARFHAAARDVVLPRPEATYLQATTPLPERYSQEWRQALRMNLDAISAETHRLPLDLRETAREYLARLPARGARISDALGKLPGSPPAMRLCLRDSHRNNIAYREGVAAAFFDWDALRYDLRIGDYARLAASFGLNAVEAGTRIVSALQEASPADELTAWESAALAPLLATQVWLPPLNWMKWLLVENRTFDEPAAALERLRETLNLSILRPFAAYET